MMSSPVDPDAIDSKPIEPAPVAVPVAPDTPARQAERLSTAPLLIWVLLQVGALAMAACRVPLAARYPSTGERLAVDLILAVQVGAGALLFPWLLRDLSSALLTIASCWPMLALAVALAALTPATLIDTCAYITLWLTAMAIWRIALKNEKAQAIGAAIAGGWAIGGPILWYLRSEFNSRMESTSFPAPFYGPLTGALAQVEVTASRGMDWVILAIALFLGIVAAWTMNRLSRRGEHPPGAS